MTFLCHGKRISNNKKVFISHFNFFFSIHSKNVNFEGFYNFKILNRLRLIDQDNH